MNNSNIKLVFVLLLQSLVSITLISATNTTSLSPVANKTTANNTTGLNNNSHDAPHKMEVLTEGGEIDTQLKPPVNGPHFGGREGEVIIKKSNHNNASSTVSALQNSSTTSKTVIQANSSTTSTTELPSKPVYENKSLVPDIASNMTHKAISPRKGVNYPEYQLSLNATTVKPKPKKPTVTVAADEEPYMPSHFQTLSKSNSSASQSIPKVPNFDMLNENNQGNTQKYVVPIVIVILSVPFVAILISILYKRGAEWWKYRHYRRMDFLINGMYDN